MATFRSTTATLAACGVIAGCGGPSLESVERQVGDEVGDDVTCVEAGDRRYDCSGEEADYRARTSKDGSRVVVREKQGRCNPAFSWC